MDLVVLAGGRSRRMGTEKAILQLGSETLIETVVHRLQPLFENVIVSTADGHSFSRLDLTEVADIYPDCGSLGGLYAGLSAATSDYVFAVACDMPLVNLVLVRRMISLSEGFDVVVPRTCPENTAEGEPKLVYLEPLHAVYGKSCLNHMEELLGRKELRIFDLFDKVMVRYVEADEIRAVDPDMLSFFNVNTPADLERARRIISAEESRKRRSDGEP
jgi:molybdopterin-guanine dinucleotide biosynthesis protein A